MQSITQDNEYKSESSPSPSPSGLRRPYKIFTSPSHQAFSIPDILEEILERSSDSARAVAARLSSQWLDVALEKLWKDLDSVLPLLKLISPLSGGGNTETIISFTHALNDVDWSRFSAYACRVRSIAWNDEGGVLSNEIFAQIFFQRPPTHPLLPRIETITWTASKENTLIQLLPMVCNSLTTLKLRINAPCPAQAVTSTLKGLNDRGARLKNLDIQAWFNVGDIEIPLTAYLCDQWELREVGLPQYYGTKEIVTVLGSLPKLEVLRTTNLLAEAELGMQWELGEGTFSNLSSFGFNASLTMAKYIFSLHPFSRLSAISITPPSANAAANDLGRFLVTLASRCPRLSSVHFNLCQHPPEIPAFDVQELSPLFSLECMEVLEVDSRQPVVGIDRRFISEIAAVWPTFRRLRLTPEPTTGAIPEGGSPISILRDFAELFGASHPSFVSIGLYFSVNRGQFLNTQDIHTWPTLSELHVGTSHLEETDVLSVASFLGGICRPGVTIKAGRACTRIPVDPWGRALYPDEARMGERWKRTAETVKMIHTSMRPLRYALEVSESEVARARARARAQTTLFGVAKF
ncbi:hypothetical protein FRB94_002893 [Tulasnella sp. JGI-2019a]|nr:hypothetical protein FRB94_002893 [Tulasnella sp. JGI-2019a]